VTETVSQALCDALRNQAAPPGEGRP